MIIREAIRDDLLSVARVQVESSRSAYRGIMPDSYLDNMSYEIKAREWDERLFGGGSTEFMYVAETDNAGIVGYASASKTRINEIYERELISLYILKEFQRNGIGKQLFEAVISEFSKCKVSSM
ncbi:MAG: GNAT family N-acetyltransferase, partial [Bacillota bacterium]|nr:GNAT family N-acetyltransferase [Bacillota bacterium]